MFNLKGKTAFVTGSGSGIGAAVAEMFASAGATVWIADRDVTNGQAVAERIHRSFVALDVAAESDCDQAAKQVGAVDVLACIAGIGQVGRLLNTTAVDLDRMFAVNVRGFQLLQSVCARDAGAQA